MRGNRGPGTLYISEQRSIPARAGEPTTTSALAQSKPVYPPRAGEPRARARALRLVRVYPRARVLANQDESRVLVTSTKWYLLQ